MRYNNDSMATPQAVKRKEYQQIVGSLVVFVIMLAPMVPNDNYLLENDNIRMEQLGGDGSIEERCSTITFEDIFEYTKADFNFIIDDNWNSAAVSASAWINWSMADTVRERLDSYLAGIFPSGGDGWLSTDERDAVLGIAADCIEHTLTRIGIRDGPSHRGGVGVDWRNTTWESGSIDVTVVNGIPLRHSEGRECDSWQPGNQCFEVPVIPSSDRDCDVEIDNSQGKDECKFLLFLNATMELPGISNPDSFSLVLNASNMSNADLKFKFPYHEDLRLDMWEECEGRYLGEIQPTEENNQSPLRGSCIGDNSTSYEINANTAGEVTYSIYLNSHKNNWPEGEDIFADFTNSPIPVDLPPIWTEHAPVNDSWLPTPFSGEIMWASWTQISSWFNDENGVSNLDIRCQGPIESSVYQKSDRSYWAKLNNLLDINCEALDFAGQSSGNRTWHLGNPIEISTSNNILQNPHIVSLELSEEWPLVTLYVALTQGGEVEFSTISIDSTTDINLTSTSMIPGPVYVHIIVEGVNIYKMENLYDIGLIKESTPPYISISDSYWLGSKWISNGQFSDSDGEDVTFTLSVDDSEIGAIIVSGNSWETPQINFDLWSEGEHIVSIIGCDTSSKCSEVYVTVNNSHLWEQQKDIVLDQEDSDESLASPGLLLTIIATAGALMYTRRRH